MNDSNLDEDEFGHCWGTGWEESDEPHPGFGGSYDIYGGYTTQCIKCGLYGHEFKKQLCEEVIENGKQGNLQGTN